MNKKNSFLNLLSAVLTLALLFSPALAEAKETDVSPDELQVIDVVSPQGQPHPAEQSAAEEKVTPADNQAVMPLQPLDAAITAPITNFDPLKYTLGAEDVVEITVLRHPEFSGNYPINLEGKIQYKFVGDMIVTGLTKKQLEDKIKGIVADFVINPEVNVTILEYKSKVFYVLGEVGVPGKFYMQSESIPVREAVVRAGLPTLAAAMRRCRLITPTDKGKPRIKSVDLYSILYGGNLARNLSMKPGDVLYVPATVMAKVVRVINPVTSAVGSAVAGPSSVSSGRTSVDSLAR